MNKTWNQCLSENVRHYGIKTALIDGDRRYTYDEMYRYIQSLAAYLRKKGIGKGDRVAVMLDNSAEAVIALQAVIFAGAGYVPVNINDAIERKKQIIDDSECRLLITDKTYDSPSLTLCEKIQYDMQYFESDGNNVSDINDDEDTAYVLYTSGSTGTPKGAVLSHKNLICQMEGLRKEYQLDENDVWSQFHTICFDFSVLEIFGALYNGATLAIVPKEAKSDGSRLLSFVEETQITVLGLVPSVMYKIKVSEAKKCKVRLMILGGEKLGFKSLKPWFEKVPDMVAVNGYGLTETTIFNAGKKIDINSDFDEVGNIGKAFEPNIMLLIGADGKIVKDCDAEGEIILGGSTVSKGYLKNEKLNREKYLTIPEYGNTRFFKTGDYGKLNAAGEVCFTGRKDNQVKIRGFRIEIEEIEGKLRRHPDIRDVAVKIDRERELIQAFVAGDDLTTENIYMYAKKNLPKYMIPQRIKIMSSLPVTERGKVDKSKLSMGSREGMINDFAPCKTDTEIKIRNIWEECLSADEEIGIHDSFYELGGDSLNVIRMIESIEHEFHREIKLLDFLDSPDIYSLSKLVSEGAVSEDIDIQHKYSSEFPMTDLQQAFFIGRASTVALGNCASHSYTEILCHEYDKNKVVKVIETLVNRHAMLRCRFDELGNHHICTNINIDITEHDFTGLPEEEKERQMLNIRKRMESMIPDTSVAPLASVEISKISQDKGVVHLYVDALISDGWSHELLLYEADRLYSHPDEILPENDFTFGDYVEYCENKKNTARYQSAKEFWTGRIKNLPDNPQLPVGEPDDGDEPVVSRQLRKKIDWENWKKVEEYASEEGLTSFVISLTAFCKAVARYSKNQHFVINLPVSDRPSEFRNIDKLVGVCSNFFLLDFENVRGETLYETALRVQKRLWELKENDSFNGNEIIREIYRENGEVGSFVASMVFTSLMDIPFPKKETLERTYLETHTSQIWMDTVVMSDDDGISFNCDFVEGMIEEELADNIITTCINLVKSYGDNPETWKNIREILPEKTELDALRKHNGVRKQLEDKSVIEYLKENAENEGDREFLLTNTGKITYGEFYKEVCKLANLIKKNQKNDIVAVVTNKSAYQIKAIFAIIAAGAVYVPLDENFPAEVLEDIIRKTEIKMILTDNDNISKIVQIDGIPNMVNVLNVEDDIEPADELLIPEKRSIYQPFVIIFTSGTTGKPKGIRLNEAGIINSVIFTNERYDVDKDDTAIALTNVCHDMSMYDMFGMVMAGGSLIVPEKSEARDPDEWKQLLKKYEVTIINSVPAFTEMLLLALSDDEKKTLLNGLRLVIQGGDFLKPAHAKEIMDISGGLHLVNVGGPTETSLWSIYHDVTHEEVKGGEIAYGKAICNMKHYILNDNLEIVPRGVKGTIYSEGIGLAEEYVDLEELTERKFITWNNKRLFNTGDVGYYNNEYEMMIKGRDDHQVKINGKRIEPEEIEIALNTIKGISGSIVVCLKEKNSLVAFYLSDNELEKSYITDKLSEKLAYYMIPSEYIRKETLPVTRNGKPDRNLLKSEALLWLERDNALNVNSDESDEANRKILDITRNLLENNHVGLHDNFFMSGGNSILAIRLIAAIKKEFGVSLKIGDIFASADISSWKKMIQASETKSQDVLKKNIVYDRVPLSAAQTGIWFYEQIHHDSKYTVLAYVDIEGEGISPDISLLSKSVDSIVCSSVIFDLGFFADDEGIPYQKILKRGEKAGVLEVIETKENIEKETNELAKYIFSIDENKLYRFIYLKENDNKGRLVMLIHHLIADEATLELFYKDLIAGYKGNYTKSVSNRYLQYSLEKSKVNYDKELLKKDFMYVTQDMLDGIKETAYTKPVINERRLNFEVDAEEKLKNAGVNVKSTLFATAYSLYIAALYLTFGDENIVTTTTFSDRMNEEDVNEYGMYVYNHLISCKLNYTDKLSEINTNIAGQIRDVLNHPILSVSDEVRILGLPSEYLKLTNNYVFTYVDSDRKQTNPGGVRFEPLRIEKKVGDTNIQLLIEKIDGKFTGSIYYSDYIDESDIEKLSSYVERLINNCNELYDVELIELLEGDETQPDELGELF